MEEAGIVDRRLTSPNRRKRPHEYRKALYSKPLNLKTRLQFDQQAVKGEQNKSEIVLNSGRDQGRSNRDNCSILVKRKRSRHEKILKMNEDREKKKVKIHKILE